MDQGTHWSDQSTLNGRGFFEARGETAVFAIESVKSSDSGVYRCRVDFQKNPTRNSKVNLTVISKYIIKFITKHLLKSFSIVIIFELFNVKNKQFNCKTTTYK